MRKHLNLRLLALFLVLALAFAPMFGVQAQEGSGESTPAVSSEEHGTTEAGATEETAVAEAEEAPPSPLAPLGINSGFLIAQIINFGAIFIFLLFILWRPLVNMLDARAAKIAKGLEDAAAAAKARMNAEQEAEGILAKARAEANKIIEEARARGDEVAKSIEVAARNEADKIKSDARAEAAAARDAELAGLRDQVLNISVAVAQRIIGENLDAKKQKALVDNFFSKVPAEAKNFSGSVEVVSAMPLSDAEQSKVKEEIGASDVVFSVDPNILGGLVVRSADRVVDGSVRGNLSNLASRLN